MVIYATTPKIAETRYSAINNNPSQYSHIFSVISLAQWLFMQQRPYLSEKFQSICIDFKRSLKFFYRLLI
jgi:hypothetical protein